MSNRGVCGTEEVLVLNRGFFGVELRGVLNWGVFDVELWGFGGWKGVALLCGTDELNWAGCGTEGDRVKTLNSTVFRTVSYPSWSFFFPGKLENENTCKKWHTETYVKKCICESQHRFDLQVNRRALDWWKMCDQTDKKLGFSQQNEKMKIEIRKDFVWRIWAFKGLLAKKKVSDIFKGLTSYPWLKRLTLKF